MPDFFRFPHTPHLAWLGEASPRDDKVLLPDDASALLAGTVTVEEKLDGANLGFSLASDGHLRVQNRGQYLDAPFTGQFVRLGPWLALHENVLFDALTPGLIAFGEWCAARHSLDYSALPDWWLVFDVYDRAEARFWSVRRRNEWARAAGFHVVPALSQGQTNVHELISLLDSQRSRYRDGPLEGVVVRHDSERISTQRAKLVRADFTQHITQHWRQRAIEWNRLASPV